MKKVLSLILVLTFIITAFAIAPINTYAVGDKSTSAEKAGLLKQLGIVYQIPDEITGVEKVSRGEFATYLNAILQNNDGGKECLFTDVPSDHWALEAINNLTKLGYISMNDEKLFRPTENIKVNEAIKLAISMAGYKDYAEANGGYPVGYSLVAKQLGIDVEPAVELSYNGAVNLIYDVLQVPYYQGKVYQYTSEDYVNIEYKSTNETLLSMNFDIYKATGIVSMAKGISLKGERVKQEDSNKVVVSGVEYKTNLDVSDRLGRYLTFFYKQKDDTEVPSIVYTVAPRNSEEVIELDIKDDFVSFEDNTINYFDVNGKKIHKTVPANAIFVKNGTVIRDGISKIFDVKKGKIRIIDADNNDEIDCIFIWEYTNYIVKMLDKDNLIVYDELDIGKTFKLDSKERYVVIKNSSGADVAFSNLANGNVVSVYESEKYVKAVIGASSNTGTVFGVAETDGDYVISVGKSATDVNELTVDPYYYETYIKGVNKGGVYKIDIGVSITYFTDVAGNIAKIVFNQTSDGWTFAYLISHGETGGVASTIKMKMFTQANEIKTFETLSKVTVDGVIRKNSKDVLADLNKKHYGKEMQLNEDLIDGQLLRIKVTDNNKISAIDTEYVNQSKEGRISLRRTNNVSNLYYYYYTMTFGGKIARGGKTVHFVVPPHDKLKDAEAEDFAIAALSYFFDKAWNIEGFRLNEEGGIEDAVVAYADTTSSSKSTYALVDSVLTTINNDGEQVRAAYVYSVGTGAKSLVLGSNKCPMTLSDGTEVASGDIISYQIDSKGAVGSITMVYDYSRRNDPTYEIKTSTALNYSENSSLMYTYVKNISEGIVRIKGTKPTEFDYLTGNLSNADNISTMSASFVLIYDSEKEEISKGTSSDILSADIVGIDKATPYWLVVAYGQILGAVIYK